MENYKITSAQFCEEICFKVFKMDLSEIAMSRKPILKFVLINA